MLFNHWILLIFVSFIGFSQQSDSVDFKEARAALQLFPQEKTIQGEVTYTFSVLQDTDTVFLDAVAMDAQLAKTSKNTPEVQTTTNKILFLNDFVAGKSYEVTILYEAEPKQAMYFFEEQVWTQGQGKETSHWLPSLNDVTDKMVFHFSVLAPKAYTVLANGQLIKETETPEGQQWDFQMEKPMSSYLAALVIGPFEAETIKSTSGIPIENYYTPDMEGKVEPTYRYTKEIMDFMEKEIGVAYPWEIYKQAPVHDFLYAGMENTTLTTFSESFVVDSIGFTDRNYVQVNAHELAHQWFGNLVTATSGKHHWLQEGFATYYALLAEKEVFGEAYYYWQLYQSAEQLMERSEEGKGEAVLKTGASSLTYYQKGAWALHILREKIGDKAFKKGVKTYLEQYAFSSTDTEAFLKIMEESSGADLSNFKKDWLQQSAFKASEALESLRKSTFITDYLELAALAETPLSEKRDVLETALDVPVQEFLGQEAVYQLSGFATSDTEALYRKALESGNTMVRQAVAVSLQSIPKSLQTGYEGLLKDESYLTIEAALYHLWNNFPEKRDVYLDATKEMSGFSDKNIRLLWLVLASVTPDYEADKKTDFYEELSGYTSNSEAFAVRENAFQYLYSLNQFSEMNLKDLVEACLHPNWRFAKSSRELLDTLLEDADTKKRLMALEHLVSEKTYKWLEERAAEK